MLPQPGTEFQLNMISFNDIYIYIYIVECFYKLCLVKIIDKLAESL